VVDIIFWEGLNGDDYVRLDNRDIVWDIEKEVLDLDMLSEEQNKYPKSKRKRCDGNLEIAMDL